MNSNLLFNFTVNEATNTILVTREFNADLNLVWRAFTEPAILDQWWAPKPYMTVTKSMDFNVGGTWLYAMVAPTGEKHWCLANYKAIDLHKSFSALDSFCDEEGNMNQEIPSGLWTNQFKENNTKTTFEIAIVYEKLDDIKTIIELGFEEGFTMALGNLDEYFEAKKQD